ncbi:MAG TPA: arsenate reductase ArsC [Geobacter anodireducens]|nr:arsenate reductase ArsC [Geobacter anodireducens]
MKQRVLLLCTHNANRSQMAEGLVNYFLSDRWEACSAGTIATSVNPRATRTMAELGIDISGQRSKNLTELDGQTFDRVITLCGEAADTCPIFVGGVRREHLGFDDPSRATGTDEEIMDVYRRVRDEMRRRVITLLNGGDHE